MMSKKVAVALSGGIDSLVAAFLLKQQHFDVFGIHFITGYETVPVDLDRLKSQLDIDIEIIDLRSAFETKVVSYFIDAYLNGRTPNPCMICNKEIKFGDLLLIAMQKGADFLATGHYAGIQNEIVSGHSLNYLIKGKDPVKEQSYFLSFLTSNQLEKVIFPLSELTKPQVRSIARENNLFALSGNESQDICFISNKNIRDFIVSKTQIQPERGNIIDLQGKILGRHTGLMQFTVGQRRGLNCPASEPYYVKNINISNNELTVCFKKDIMEKSLSIDNIHWNYQSMETCEVNTKIRYNHKESPSWLHFNGKTATLIFDSPQFAITPGQGAVFYQKDRVLGAGIIQ